MSTDPNTPIGDITMEEILETFRSIGLTFSHFTGGAASSIVHVLYTSGEGMSRIFSPTPSANTTGVSLTFSVGSDEMMGIFISFAAAQGITIAVCNYFVHENGTETPVMKMLLVRQPVVHSTLKNSDDGVNPMAQSAIAHTAEELRNELMRFIVQQLAELHMPEFLAGLDAANKQMAAEGGYVPSEFVTGQRGLGSNG